MRNFCYLCARGTADADRQRTMNEKVTSTWHWLRRFLSPWTLLCLAVVGFLLFTGDNSVFDSIDRQHTIDSLRSEIEANRDTMLYYRELNSRLTTDRALMEQVVREQYGMKKAGEDVYVFKEN